MADITYTAAELEALAKQLQPFLKSVSPPTDSGTNPPPPPPSNPPPPVSGAKVSPRWDSAPSQWAKWNFITPGETITLQDMYDPAEVSRHINWWHSYHTLNGLYDDKTNTYRFVADTTWWGTPVWQDDKDHAADTKHLKDLGTTPEIVPLG
jgi:hypothetical protein